VIGELLNLSRRGEDAGIALLQIVVWVLLHKEILRSMTEIFDVDLIPKDSASMSPVLRTTELTGKRLWLLILQGRLPEFLAVTGSKFATSCAKIKGTKSVKRRS